MHNKVRVPLVVRYKILYRRTNDVDFKVVLSGPAESSLCQGGCKAHMTQLFRNFSMGQYENVSTQTVFQIGHFTVPLDFEAAGRYSLRRSRLTAKDFPHGRSMFCLLYTAIHFEARTLFRKSSRLRHCGAFVCAECAVASEFPCPPPDEGALT